MRGRSKALGINALAKRWNETFCDGKPKPSNAQAKQGVTRHWQSKLSHGLTWRQTRVFNIRAKDFNNEGNEGSYHFS